MVGPEQVWALFYSLVVKAFTWERRTLIPLPVLRTLHIYSRWNSFSRSSEYAPYPKIIYTLVVTVLFGEAGDVGLNLVSEKRGFNSSLPHPGLGTLNTVLLNKKGAAAISLPSAFSMEAVAATGFSVECNSLGMR